MWNKHIESPSISSKYVKVHQCTSRIVRGRGDILVWQRCRTLLHHVYYHFICTFAYIAVYMACTTSCKWSGTPNCWGRFTSLSHKIVSKAFWNQQNKDRDIDLQILLIQLKYVCKNVVKIDIPSLKLACPLALTPFNSTHQLSNLFKTKS